VNISLIVGAAVSVSISCVASGAVAATFVVSYEGEAPGVENTTATFTVSGVENFNEQAVHAYSQSFSTDFGTSGAIEGTYAASGNGIQINAADQYGGAGGTGKYIVAFEKTPYTLTLSSDLKGGVNYFGFWLSALDKGNFVTFFGSAGQTLFTFNPQDVIRAVEASNNPGQYYGNPNAGFKGQDGSEPFIFLNFFDTTGSFSKIAFDEVNSGGGYESDNHTVGRYTGMGQGTIIPLVVSGAVPEPATWAMMLVGFAGLGYAGRRTRRSKRLAIA
jgi:hypothetical protein